MTRESEKTWLLFEIVFSLLIHWLRVTFCTNPDSNQTFIFCVWRKRAHTDGELAPLTLQPWHHLPCLLPFPGSHCSTHWLEASGDDPSSDKHKRVLCGPWVCLQYSGSQQVRTVEGGVRRWEGFRGWRGDIVWRGSGWRGGGCVWRQGFSCFAKMGRNNPDIMTLWAHKNTLTHRALWRVDPVTSSATTFRREKIELLIW